MERRYLALVMGHVADDRGVVEAPIGRSSRTPTKMAVTAAGKPARTTYTVLERGGAAEAGVDQATTLLELALESGRTHQIRVHMAAIGHPVVGDARYGRPDPRLGSGRFFLHAGTLASPIPGRVPGWSSAHRSPKTCAAISADRLPLQQASPVPLASEKGGWDLGGELGVGVGLENEGTAPRRAAVLRRLRARRARRRRRTARPGLFLGSPHTANAHAETLGRRLQRGRRVPVKAEAEAQDVALEPRQALDGVAHPVVDHHLLDVTGEVRLVGSHQLAERRR